ncbi:MAG: FtsW/RodA/SpoVE family cell cycle protein, partial [Eggerthellaceae bacterium]|nr:FtsW/RodA/SpoVE family cell cycle protein [Eggerthellaceae bacterium]
WADGQGGLGAGYQLAHSLYALATGGLFGVGIGSSSEKLGSLPEADTDFVFAVIGEECGLLGAAGVIALFLALLWAGMRISDRARSPFAATVAGALTVALVFQAFLNIASVIGAFPMTGKPLPFVSYGGSSLVSVGIIASAARAGAGGVR